MHLKILAALGLLLSSSPSLAKPKVDPVVSFATDAVLVHVAPKSSVALFGFSWEVVNFGVDPHSYSRFLTDVDGDGWIRVQLREGLVTRSVWTAVDLTSGKSSTALSPYFELERLPFPADAVRQFDVQLSSLRQPVVFVARPGAGGWVARPADNAVGDLDPTIGVLDVGVESFRPLGATPALTHFARRDVIFAVNMLQSSYTVRRVQ